MAKNTHDGTQRLAHLACILKKVGVITYNKHPRLSLASKSFKYNLLIKAIFINRSATQKP
jgi:hypothetical protein